MLPVNGFTPHDEPNLGEVPLGGNENGFEMSLDDTRDVKRKYTDVSDDRADSELMGSGTPGDRSDEAGPSRLARSVKQKTTRGPRACTNCHRLKMKCEGAVNGGACARCARSGHQCVFLESHRGRKSEKRQKSTAIQQSLRKMEHVLMSVLQNMGDQDPNAPPSDAGLPKHGPSSRDRDLSGTPGGTRSESPGHEDDPRSRSHSLERERGSSSVRNIAEAAANFVQQMNMYDESVGDRLLEPNGAMSTLLNNCTSAMMAKQTKPRAVFTEAPESPKLHSLPDNTLNPLGLLAEASLRNAQRQRGKSEVDNGADDPVVGGATGGESSGGAGAQAQNGSGQRPSQQYGLANDSYFRPSSMVPAPVARPKSESDRPPELLTDGIITSEEAIELFRIFFHYCSLHMFLLDPDWHTPTLVCSRSPFLFTCVCCVAAKFYTKRSDLYVKCLRKAKKAAFDVMSRGLKSTEIVQAFLMLTLYNQPAERFEEDPTWLFAGVAIRMAQDLNLHRKTVVQSDQEQSEEHEREIMNRERTWYICFCVDRTLCAQMGKPYMIREDWMIRHATEWCTQKYSRPADLGICALVNLVRVQTRQLDFLYSSTVTPSGLNLDLDYPSILPSFNEQLHETIHFWFQLGLDSMIRSWNPQAFDVEGGNEQNGTSTGAESSRPHAPSAETSNADTKKEGPQQPKPTLRRRGDMDRAPPGLSKLHVSTLLALQQAGPPDEDADLNTRSMYYIARQAPLRYNYALLVLNSFGLQYALERPDDGASVDKPQYLVRCVHAAKEIISTVKYGLREILRFAPDPTFVAVAYACVFLLKLIRPVFANYINEDQVIQLVSNTIEILEEAAVDATHTPALYASFLRSLLHSRHDAAQSGDAPSGSTPSVYTPRTSHPPANDSWPRGQPGTMRGVHGAEMTVDPTQVNPIAAELAQGAFSDINASANVPLNTTFADSQFPNETPSADCGWDAQQYAKAQGVEVNRVLDNSFWSSLLPPGYGGGSMSQMGITTFDPMRDSDFFKISSAQPGAGQRTTLTPGATRASSPALDLGGPFAM